MTLTKKTKEIAAHIKAALKRAEALNRIEYPNRTWFGYK